MTLNVNVGFSLPGEGVMAHMKHHWVCPETDGPPFY